ncbi:MAG TPA: PAS domain S-box protein, partial [Flavitalea sp.]|nr:PAS domain S-box protein [Flavitalea sp.]
MWTTTQKNNGSFPAPEVNLNLLQEHPLPVWIIEKDSLQCVFSNTAAGNLFGYSPHEMPFAGLPGLMEEQARNLFANERGHFQIVVNVKHKKGFPVFVEMYGAQVSIHEKIFFQVTGIDVSGRMKPLRSSANEVQHYQSFIQHSADGIFCLKFRQKVAISDGMNLLIEQTRNNSFVIECNDALAKMFGYGNAAAFLEANASTLTDIPEPSDLDYFPRFVEAGFSIHNFDCMLKDRNGRKVLFNHSATGIVEDGYLEGIWFRLCQTPVNRTAEVEMRIMANMVEQTSDMLTSADKDFKPMTWNSAAEKVFGLTKEQVIGKDFRDFFDINYHNATREEVRAFIALHGEWRGEASFVRANDGKSITMLMGFKKLTNSLNEVLCYLITGTDITERKQAESLLRESEQRFRDMADSAPAIIWMCDENNSAHYFNKQWFDFTGSDIAGTTNGWLELVHADDRQKVGSKYKYAFEKKIKVTLNYRLRSAHGGYRWVHDVRAPRFLQDKKFVGYIGSIIDIEEAKSKEEALLYQATILENVSDIIITTDLDFNIKSWNNIAELHYGIAEKDVTGKKMGTVVSFNYEGITADEARLELQIRGIWKGEVSIYNEKGEKKYFLQTVKYVQDEDNRRIGYLAMGRDITEMKMAEVKLQKSEQFYRAMIADSLDGLLLMNAFGNITFVSPPAKQLLGYEEEDVMDRNGFEFVHPDDLKWAFDSFQREVDENPEIKSIVVRLQKKSGEWLWCRVRGHNLLKNPDVQSIVVYFHDDTLRKQASDALKESEKRFRTLILDLQVGVLLQDAGGHILMSNNAMQSMFGEPEETL